MAVIKHIVLFQFKPDASASTISDVCKRMLALKEQCMDSSTKQPLVISCIGGKDISTEGMQNGYTHPFIVEFASEQDRDAYVVHEAHVNFVKSLADVVHSATVVDFVPGQF
ncbi:MAG: hypothetical protein M1826_007509 [Phylliscum demangeonii]|nr:MAG: hypothetical protein M1826_007509 [Phylliscum demangeonii]